MNTVPTGAGARSGCQVQNVEPEVAEVTLQYTAFVVNGDPVLRYGAVIDRPVPLDVSAQITDADGNVLQTADPIRLVPE